MKNFVLFFLLSFFIEGVFGESLSVKEGDSVTLHTGLTEIQKKEDVLDWRFGAGRDRIARVRKDRDPTIYDDVLGGRFRGRPKSDGQTGDLTITNITTEHAGPYEISINNIVIRTFSVIVVPADPVKTVSVMVGDSLTLKTGVPEPQRYDVIQWRFKNSSIAEISRKTINSFPSYTTDEGFRGRLQLDYWTGSLTIRNITTTHSGDYEFDISISSHTIHRPFTVTVSGELKSPLSVMKGESVTLNSDLTEIQTDDLMQWTFGDSQIAEIYKPDNRSSTSDDRLKLDPQTGSLNITDTRFTDSGLYELKISSSRRTVLKRFTVIVTVTVTVTVTVDPGLSPGLSTGAIAGISVVVLLAFAAAVAAVVFYYRHKNSELKARNEYTLTILSVIQRETITLKPDEVHKDDKLLWIFKRSSIAEWKSAADRFTLYDDVLDGRFKGRLKLNHQTGSLTITNTKTSDSGEYELQIIRSGKISIKRFSVSVFAKTEIKQVSVNEGESVTLETDVNDIKKVELIQWKFGLDTPLAKIKGKIKEISPSVDKIFKGRLKLNHQTGSLTIDKIRPTDAGIYMLYKIEEGDIKTILFRVEVSESTDNRNNPEEESVRINDPETVPLNSAP